jgi:hypothetical protein
MRTETIVLLVLAGGALWWWTQRSPAGKAARGAGAGAATTTPETVPEEGAVAISNTFEPQWAAPVAGGGRASVLPDEAFRAYRRRKKLAIQAQRGGYA